MWEFFLPQTFCITEHGNVIRIYLPRALLNLMPPIVSPPYCNPSPSLVEDFRPVLTDSSVLPVTILCDFSIHVVFLLVPWPLRFVYFLSSSDLVLHTTLVILIHCSNADFVSLMSAPPPLINL
jgi:hypothetical protein